MRPDIYWSSLVLRWSWIRSRGRPIRRRTRSRPAALCVVIISIASAEYIAKVATKGLTSVNVDGLFCRLYRAAGDISSRKQLDVVDSEFAHSSASLAEDVTVTATRIYKREVPFHAFFLNERRERQITSRQVEARTAKNCRWGNAESSRVSCSSLGCCCWRNRLRPATWKRTTFNGEWRKEKKGERFFKSLDSSDRRWRRNKYLKEKNSAGDEWDAGTIYTKCRDPVNSRRGCIIWLLNQLVPLFFFFLLNF